MSALLTPYAEFETSRGPVVWQALLEYVLAFTLASTRFAYTFLHSLFSSGRAKPIVYPETFPLERLADGLVALEKRKTWGKVIVHVREPESSPHSKAKL